jgi:cystathionine gamma-lyase
MREHCKNAQIVAEYLESRPDVVESVIYPGLKSHPQHAIAVKQMRGFGGMITFFLKGGLSESRIFLENLQLFALAESLGAVESLAEHPAIMTHASVPPEQRKMLGISDSLIRLSVGIEDIQGEGQRTTLALQKEGKFCY